MIDLEYLDHALKKILKIVKLVTEKKIIESFDIQLRIFIKAKEPNSKLPQYSSPLPITR